MINAPELPETIYRRRSEDFGALHEQAHRQSRRVGDIGMVLLIIAIVFWAVAFLRAETPWFVAAGLISIAFVFGVARRNRLNLEAERFRLLAGINAEGIARLQRDWDRLPMPGVVSAGQK